MSENELKSIFKKYHSKIHLLLGGYFLFSIAITLYFSINFNARFKIDIFTLFLMGGIQIVLMLTIYFVQSVLLEIFKKKESKVQ